jgi:hypothetical protein
MGRAAEATQILNQCGGRGVHSEMHSPIQTGGVFSTP